MKTIWKFFRLLTVGISMLLFFYAHAHSQPANPVFNFTEFLDAYNNLDELTDTLLILGDNLGDSDSEHIGAPGFYSSEVDFSINGSKFYITGLGAHSGFTFEDYTYSINIYDLTLKEFTTDLQGAAMYISNASSVTLTNVSFLSNTADIQGGALYVQGASDIKLSNVTFEGNAAGSNLLGQGGALFNVGTFNDVQANSGNILFTDGFKFVDNTMEVGYGVATLAQGGAFFLSGAYAQSTTGAESAGDSTVITTFRDIDALSVFEDNKITLTAVAASFAKAQGGAMFIVGANAAGAGGSYKTISNNATAIFEIFSATLGYYSNKIEDLSGADVDHQLQGAGLFLAGATSIGGNSYDGLNRAYATFGYSSMTVIDSNLYFSGNEISGKIAQLQGAGMFIGGAVSAHIGVVNNAVTSVSFNNSIINLRDNKISALSNSQIQGVGTFIGAVVTLASLQSEASYSSVTVNINESTTIYNRNSASAVNDLVQIQGVGLFVGAAVRGFGGNAAHAISTVNFRNSVSIFNENTITISANAVGQLQGAGMFVAGSIDGGNDARSVGSASDGSTYIDVYLSQLVYLDNTIITDNGYTQAQGGGLFIAGSVAGGQNASATSGVSVVNFTSSVMNFNGNLVRADGTNSQVQGGGLFIAGSVAGGETAQAVTGSVYVNFSSAIVTFRGNKAISNPVSLSQGGALYIGKLVVAEGNIKTNSADVVTVKFTSSSVDFIGNKAREGAAIYVVDSTITFDWTKLTFTDNSDEDGNGEAIYAKNANIVFNSIGTNGIVFNKNISGNAVDIRLSTTTLNFNVFSGNVLLNNGIYAKDESIINKTGLGRLTLGGVNYFSSVIFNVIGGGLLEVNNATFTYSYGSADNEAKGFRFTIDGSTLVYNNSSVTFSNNSSDHDNIASAITALNASSISFVNSAVYFFDNKMVTDGGDGEINRGVIALVNGSIASFIDVTLVAEGNYSSDGGVFYDRASGTTLIRSKNSFKETYASNNIAKYNGGVFNIGGTTITFTNTTVFSSNTALRNDGGVIFATEVSSLIFRGETFFTSNTANLGKGGALYLDSSFVLFNGNTYFTSNSANAGGAIYATNGSTIVFRGNTLFFANVQSAEGEAADIQVIDSYITINADGTDDIVFSANEESTIINPISISLAGSSLTLNALNNDIIFEKGGLKSVGSSLTITGVKDEETAETAQKQVLLNNTNSSFESSKINLVQYSILKFNNSTFTYKNSDTLSLYISTLSYQYSRADFTGNSQAIYANGSSVIEFFGSTVNFANNNNNVATADGGAISIDGSLLSINRSSAFFINNSADNGGGAIVAVNSDILFIESTVSFISNNTGVEAGALFIDAGSILIRFSSVDFISNESGSAGAIEVAGGAKVNIENSQMYFEKNKADDNGGAIFADKVSEFNINSSVLDFISNGAISAQFGGAIYLNQSNLSIASSILNFIDNKAGKGGAIYAEFEDDVDVLITIANSTLNFISNQTDNPSSGAMDLRITNLKVNASSLTFVTNNGGGLALAGSTKAEISFSTVNFIGNESGEGAAIFLGNNSNIEFSFGLVSFISNLTQDNGGAIYANNSSIVRFFSETVNFTSNSTGGTGGAVSLYRKSNIMSLIFDTTIASFVNNIAGNDGGAIELSGSEFSVSDSTVNFTSNTAGGTGGAINASDVSTIKFDKSIVNFTSNNISGSDYGGAIYASNSNIEIVRGSTVNFIHNTALEARGGAVGLYLDLDLIEWNNEGLHVSNSVVNFTSNTATAAGALGAIARVVDFSNSIVSFTSNTATVGYGGAIAVQSSSLAFSAGSNVTFIRNIAGINGGAIFGYNSGLSFTNSLLTFSQNQSQTDGGAISLSENSLAIFNSSTITFDNNSALADGATGGAIALNGSTMTFDNNYKINFANNKIGVSGNGGAIFADASKITFNNSTVTFNNNVIAQDAGLYTGLGGAIYATKGSSVEFNKSFVQFSGNKTGTGGAIYIASDSTVAFRGSTVTFLINEVSGGKGGSIYLDPNNATVLFDNTDSVFNVHKLDYGATIYASAKSVVMFNGGNALFSGNRSFSGNGIIHVDDDAQITFGNTNITAINNEALEGGFLYFAGTLATPREVFFSGNVSLSGNQVTKPKTDGIANGGAINATGNTKIAFTGRFKIDNGVTSIDKNTTTIIFSGNSAYVPVQGASIDLAGGGAGGALYIAEEAIVNFNNTKVDARDNVALSSGGFMYLGSNVENSSVVLNRTLNVVGNKSMSASGGAIYTSGTHIRFSIAENYGNDPEEYINFSNNKAHYSGGALYIFNSSVSFIAGKDSGNIIFADNEALNGQGGAIYLSGYDEVHVATLNLVAHNGSKIGFYNNSMENTDTSRPGAISNDIFMAQYSELVLGGDQASEVKIGYISEYQPNPNASGVSIASGNKIIIRGSSDANNEAEIIISDTLNFANGSLIVESGRIRNLANNVNVIGTLNIKAGGVYSTLDPSNNNFATHTTKVTTVTISGTLEIAMDMSDPSVPLADVINATWVTIDAGAILNITAIGAGVKDINLLYITNDDYSHALTTAVAGGFSVTNITLNNKPYSNNSKYEHLAQGFSGNGTNEQWMFLTLTNSLPLPEIPGLDHNQKEAAVLLDHAPWEKTRWDIKDLLNNIINESSRGNFAFSKEGLDSLSGIFAVNSLKSATMSNNSISLFARLKSISDEYKGKQEEEISQSVWVQGHTGGFSFNDDGETFGEFKSNGYGTQAGVNLFLGGNVLGGLFVGYDSNELKQNLNKADVTDIEVGIYGGWFGSKVNVKTTLSAGKQDYSLKRNLDAYVNDTSMGSQNTTADFNTKAIRLAGEVEYIVRAGNYTSIKPFVGLKGGLVLNDKIQEKTDGLFGLTIDEDKYLRLQSQVGLKLEFAARDIQWYVKGYAGYLLVGNEAGYAVRYTKIEDVGVMDIWGTQETDFTGGVGAGVETSLTPNFGLFVDGDLGFGGEQTSYYAGLGISYKFGYSLKTQDRELKIPEKALKDIIGSILSDRKIKWALETRGGKRTEMVITDDEARRALGIEVGDEVYVVNGGGRIFYFTDKTEANDFVDQVMRSGGNLDRKSIRKIKISNKLIYPEGSKELGDIREGVLIKRYSNGIKEIEGLPNAMLRADSRRYGDIISVEPIPEEAKRVGRNSIITGAVQDYDELREWDLPVVDGDINLVDSLTNELGVKEGEDIHFVKYAGREFMFGTKAKADRFATTLKIDGAVLDDDTIEQGQIKPGLLLASSNVTGIGKIGSTVAVIKYASNNFEIMTIEERNRRNEALVISDGQAQAAQDRRDSPVIKSFRLEVAYFKLNEFVLTDLAKDIIRQQANEIKRFDYYKITIEGHTDITGTDEINRRLSKQRAEVVYREFILNGIPQERLEYVGFGAMFPISTNMTDEGRAKNRRTEIFVE